MCLTRAGFGTTSMTDRQLFTCIYIFPRTKHNRQPNSLHQPHLTFCHFFVLTMQATIRVFRTLHPRIATKPFSSSPAVASRWTTGPSPPRLPKEDQEIFEQLQQQSTGAFSTPISPTNPSEASGAVSSADGEQLDSTAARSSNAEQMLEQLRERARLAAQGDGEELHPNVRRGAPPEFEGDVNPKTGEVGGPKNDPMRWGANSDWSYNGRVTDF